MKSTSTSGQEDADEAQAMTPPKRPSTMVRSISPHPVAAADEGGLEDVVDGDRAWRPGERMMAL